MDGTPQDVGSLETELQTAASSVLSGLVSERSPFLQVLTGEEAGRLVGLPPGATVLGRGDAADVILRDPAVSRTHARLEVGADGTARIVDVGSRNGVWLRGERVTEGGMRNGDLFSLGGRVVIKLAWYDEVESSLISRLYEKAIRDGETGLINRPFFLERAAALLARAARSHDVAALGLIAPVEAPQASDWRSLADVLSSCPDALVARWDETSLAVVSPRGRHVLAPVLERLPRPARVRAVEVGDGETVTDVMAAVLQALSSGAGPAITWMSPARVADGGPPVAATSVTFEVFGFGRGTARVLGTAVPDEAFKTQKARWLLVHLASAGSHGVSEDEIGEVYWPDAGLGGRKSLNTALSTLRRALGEAGADLIVRNGGFLRLREDAGVWFDVDAFEAGLARAAARRRQGDGRGAAAALEEAVRLYQGAFLGGCFLDWALRRREVYERKMTDALCDLATAAIDAGQAEDALGHAARAAEIDPFHQDAHQLVMRAHTRLGRPDRAIRHFGKVSRLLSEELGVEPSIALVEECLRARLGLDPGATL